MKIYRSILFAESWSVAYRRRKSDILHDKETVFQIIPNSYRYWAADPFVFEDGNKVYVFAELYDYIKRQGVIGYYRIDAPEKGWVPIIAEKWHLSYPQIFQRGKDIFIMPEAHVSNTLYCYRATRFPDKWERQAPIRNKVCYADTTVFNWKGDELAIAYQVKNKEYELRLLDLQHPENDKSIDIAEIMKRRPAGAMDENALIRPAQNCEEDYGRSLIFYKYQIDNNRTYHENEIGRVAPEQLILSSKLVLDGMHTYNSSDNYEVIDLKTRRLNILNLLMRTINKIC